MYILQLEGETLICCLSDPEAVERLRDHGVHVTESNSEDLQPLLVQAHPQVRGLLEGGLIKSLDRLNVALHLAQVMSEDQAPKDYQTRDILDFSPLLDSLTLPSPSFEEQNWWETPYKGHATPRIEAVGAEKTRKKNQKAQRSARKKQRRK